MEVKTKKPSLGTWGRLANAMPRAEKVTFEVNIPVVVTFVEDEPNEREGEDGVFYVFSVLHEGKEKVINTSAWTLLGELKKLTPLEGRTVRITKKLEKGRQFFVVEPIQPTE